MNIPFGELECKNLEIIFFADTDFKESLTDLLSSPNYLKIHINGKIKV